MSHHACPKETTESWVDFRGCRAVLAELMWLTGLSRAATRSLTQASTESTKAGSPGMGSRIALNACLGPWAAVMEVLGTAPDSQRPRAKWRPEPGGHDQGPQCPSRFNYSQSSEVAGGQQSREQRALGYQSSQAEPSNEMQRVGQSCRLVYDSVWRAAVIGPLPCAHSWTDILLSCSLCGMANAWNPT